MNKYISITPLVTFRIFFGLLSAFASIWSYYKNDLEERFFNKKFFFKYEGFEWIAYCGDEILIILYGVWFFSALFVAFGLFYRISIFIFFLVFTYIQLIDATNYINHYYAIILFSFLLNFIPAGRYFSIDNLLFKRKQITKVPLSAIRVFQFQIAVIYIFAGISKINYDWLVLGQPLKIWLLQNTDFPILGTLFQYHEMHIFFSWGLIFL